MIPKKGEAKMENIADLIDSLHLERVLTLEEIPNVDLYVDQVVQLFENSYSMTTRNEEEKVLTKTMINNYAKGKLFVPIKNKKYSKAHIILISLIYQLKGGLSINDIKSTLAGVNEKVVSDKTFDLDAFYESVLRLIDVDVEKVKEDIKSRAIEVEAEAEHLADPELEKVLLLITLVTISNAYRRVAEKIVDELNQAE